MKVAELRNWLEDLGEKNQEHYSRLHGTPPRCKKVTKSRPSTAHSGPIVNVNTNNELCDDVKLVCTTSSEEDLADGDKELGSRVDGKRSGKASAGLVEDAPTQAEVAEDPREGAIETSSVSSCDGSYGVIRKIQSSGDRTASTRDSTDVFPEGSQSWDTSSDHRSVNTWWSEEDFSAASFEQEDATDSLTAMPGKLFSQVAYSASLNERLRRQGSSGGIPGLEHNMGPDHVAILKKQITPLPSADIDDADSVEPPVIPETKMHNASLFSNKILTSRTLDFLCNGTTASTAAETGISTDLSVASSEDSASSVWSADSSKPSIVPGAENSTIGKLLMTAAGESPVENEGVGIKHDGVEGKGGQGGENSDAANVPGVVKPRRKLRDPKDLPFLQSKKVDHSEKVITPRPRPTPVNRGILKFGGPRKNVVERRTEELERQWAENKAASHVKKIKWGVCQRTGTYKKKVVLDVQYK